MNHSISTGLFPASLTVIAACLLASCGGMSDQEKEMVGNYYIPAVSDTRPLMELKGDRSSVVRAIRPGELSFYVTGTWRLDRDSLIIDNDASSVTIEEGDPSLVGSVAERMAYPVMSFDENVLRIDKHGVIYDYHRRIE